MNNKLVFVTHKILKKKKNKRKETNIGKYFEIFLYVFNHESMFTPKLPHILQKLYDLFIVQDMIS